MRPAGPLAQGFGRLADPKHHVVAIDFGAKRNILRCLAALGCRVTVVPASATAGEILCHEPDGVFLSNGPGDPAATGRYAVPVIQALIATGLPVFGICLGHQILALALGAHTKKMHLGHRGANHPVKDLKTGRVEITSQNHGLRGGRGLAARRYRADPRFAVRRLQRGTPPQGAAGLFGAIPSRGLAGTAGQPLPFRTLHRADRTAQGRQAGLTGVAAFGLMGPKVGRSNKGVGLSMGQPQSGVLPEANGHALFITFLLSQPETAIRTARETSAAVPDLADNLAADYPEAALTSVIGVGSDVWDRLFPDRRPAQLRHFTEVEGRGGQAPATPGDIFLHIRSERPDLNFELARRITQRFGDSVTIVEEIAAFRYLDSRDLTGFVDGTENPTGEAPGGGHPGRRQRSGFRRRQLHRAATLYPRSGSLGTPAHRRAGTNHRPNQVR